MASVNEIIKRARFDRDFKNSTRLLHVFNDCSRGRNALMVTNDELVYSIGANGDGGCGLGHNSVVQTRQLIPQLCAKNIKQFFNGWHFVIALTTDNKLYCWGRNQRGQLGKNIHNNIEVPSLLLGLDQVDVETVYCGAYHTLLLTKDGMIYGWGCNQFGQIGCGKGLNDNGNAVKPKKLFGLPKISTIYCHVDRSFAVSRDGLVYSWGLIDGIWELAQKDGGHYYNELPHIIPMVTDIKSVYCINHCFIYLLTKSGKITYFNQYANQYPKSVSEMTIETDESDLKFILFHTTTNNNCAQSEEYVYEIEGTTLRKTSYKNILDYNCEQTSSNPTIDIYFERGEYSSLPKPPLAQASMAPVRISKFTEESRSLKSKFELVAKIGKGGFGEVFKAKDKLDGLEYAIKCVNLNDSETNQDVVLQEVRTMAKLKSDHVVRYITSWLEDNCIYIQMDYCSHNLKNILDIKHTVFMRNVHDTLGQLEYYIMCRMFTEILECVQYLHELTPPVIHRDIKPQNILFDSNPTNGKFIKLCDFGLSKYQNINTMQTSKHCGTLKYMAPEIAAGSYDHRCDIYSLSIVGQDLFGIDLNSIRTINSTNCHFYTQMTRIEELLVNMYNTRYRSRPSCKDVLGDREKWALNPISIITPKDLIDDFIRQDIDQSFLVNYIKYCCNIH